MIRVGRNMALSEQEMLQTHDIAVWTAEMGGVKAAMRERSRPRRGQGYRKRMVRAAERSRQQRGQGYRKRMVRAAERERSR